MSKIDNGGPAFPQHKFEPTGHGGGYWTNVGGMSLRDWFAGQALAGIMANANIVGVKHDDGPRYLPIMAAEDAYDTASAMLHIRRQREGKPVFELARASELSAALPSDPRGVLEMCRDAIQTYAPDFMHGISRDEYLAQIDAALNSDAERDTIKRQAAVAVVRHELGSFFGDAEVGKAATRIIAMLEGRV